MPNRTIYIKDSDVPVFERAQEDLGESVSSLFADFLHDRLLHLTENEKKVLALLKQIRRDRKALKDERAGPGLVGEYDEAEAYTSKVLERLKAKDLEAARALWFGAQFCHKRANQDADTYREIKRDIDQVLGGS
jgi:hypothetical protein